MNSQQSPYKKVWLVGAGPGDPDLITVRGQRLLAEAEVVLHDALSHRGLLRYCPQAEVVDVGKRYGKRATPQPEITQLILDYARSGKRVLRLKGGDPFIFARGSEEALALVEANIPFEIVPGVTSAVAASAFAGISLTHRDLSSSVTLITGSDKAGQDWSPEAWEKLATATGTICVYMGMRRIGAIAQAIMKGGRDPNTPVAVVRWGARPQQKVVTAPLSEIEAAVLRENMGSPAIIFIGEVTTLRQKLRWYDNKPLFGKKILIPRPAHQAEVTADQVRARGAEPLVQPAIKIEFLNQQPEFLRSVSDFEQIQWLVFTSANGVEAFARYLKAHKKDARVLKNAKIAVIGPRTAAHLRQLHIEPDLVAQEYVAESLAAALLAQGPCKKVLLLRAEVARSILVKTLEAQGAEVQVVAAYRTSAVRGEERELLVESCQAADVLLLTSSSMVDSLVQALGDSAESILGGKTLLSIGPITSATLERHHLRPSVQAQEYTISGALNALEEWFNE